MTDDKKASQLPGDQPEPVETQETVEATVERQTPAPTQIKGNSVVLDSLRRAREEADTASGDQQYTLERDDNRPLQFRGILVGYNEANIAEDVRGTQVQIFVTGSGKIITAVYQWQRKEGLERERHKAKVHESPEAALDFLIGDGGGKLGRASREAWEMACNVEPSLKGHDVEVID
jgi:hypothetical protein